MLSNPFAWPQKYEACLDLAKRAVPVQNRRQELRTKARCICWSNTRDGVHEINTHRA